MPKTNTGKALRSPQGLTIAPPYHERGDEPLFRVIYIIDVNAASPLEAARQAYRLMADPQSQPPVLEVIDHCGGVLSIDLSEERPA